jgi:hypothetical protein
MASLDPRRAERIKRSLVQSTYITAAWTWFLILAAKAAEPVLVASVLYASVKLLPIVHFPPQYDVVIFIAQFVALDIGGLSLNTLAGQAKQEGNDDGASQAKRLSIALVVVMLVGVIMAGIEQVVRLDDQIGTMIDTSLLIARAILAVLYSRVIHRLRNEGPIGMSQPETVQIDEAIPALITETITSAFHDLSQHLDERLTVRESKQADALAHLRQETLALLTEAALYERDTGKMKHTQQVPKDRPFVEEPTKALSRTPKREIDDIIWPLLKSGMTVRAIAEKANTSTATVGRSRKRWENATRDQVVSQPMRQETPPEMTTGQAQQTTP